MLYRLSLCQLTVAQGRPGRVDRLELHRTATCMCLMCRHARNMLLVTSQRAVAGVRLLHMDTIFEARKGTLWYSRNHSSIHCHTFRDFSGPQ